MNQVDSQIEKGRKRLLVLIVLGLALPLGLGIYLGYLALNDYLMDNRLLNLWDLFLGLSLGFLTIFLIGQWIGRKTYQGKKWAYNFWCFLGIGLGLFILAMGFIDPENAWIYAIPGLYVMSIGALSAALKSIQRYIGSRQENKASHLIDEIGDKSSSNL